MADSLQLSVLESLRACPDLAAARVQATIRGRTVAAISPRVGDEFRTTDQGALAGPSADVSFRTADEPTPWLAAGDAFRLTDAAGVVREVRATEVERTGGVTYVKIEPVFA